MNVSIMSTWALAPMDWNKIQIACKHSFILEMLSSPAWTCWGSSAITTLTCFYIIPDSSAFIFVFYLLRANLPLLIFPFSSPHPPFFSLFHSFCNFSSPLRLFLTLWLVCVHIFFFFSPSLPLCWFVIGCGVLCGNTCHPDLDIP